MNRTIAFFAISLLILLSFACSTESQHATPTVVATQNLMPQIDSDGFELTFQLEELENANYYLSASLKLDSGSYVISPFSKDTVYGHFDMSIEDNANLLPDGPLIEIPGSVATYDPILEMPVNFIRENTVYKQKLSLDTDDDFEVEGMVFLLIEPKCAPYEIKFKIAYHEFELTVEKISTETTKEYQKWLQSTNN